MRPLEIAVDFPWDASACMGTGAYSETMVRALAKAAPESRITLLVSPQSPRNVHLPNVRYQALPWADVLREGCRQLALPAHLRSLKADCLFAPATLLPLIKACPMVATVLDVTFITHPDHYAPGLREYLNTWFDPTLNVADRLVAISEESRASLLSVRPISPDRVTVILPPIREALNRPMLKVDVDRILDALGIARPFFFHVSNLSPHKNVAFAIEVFARFVAAHPGTSPTFLFAGGGYAPNRPPDLLKYAERMGLARRVRYLGKVEDAELKALYQGCEAFLFPSLAEGWGLPVAEASCLGARVIASHQVPSAEESQRLSLDHTAWLQALEDDTFGRSSPPAISLEQAGKKLFDLLIGVVEDPSGSSSFPAPLHRRGLTPSALVGPDQEEAPKAGDCLSWKGNWGYKTGGDASEKGEDVEKPSGPPPDFAIGIRGDWHSPSGFGEAARNVFLALRSEGLKPHAIPVPKDAIQESGLWPAGATSYLDRADVWIHLLPPELFDLDLPGHHVAFLNWETDRLPTVEPTGRLWRESLNRLDEVWVPSSFLVEVLRDSGITVPIHVCPLPVDTETYSPGPRRPPRIDLPNGFDPTWTVFLYVGTWDPRKRPDVLVRSFCRTFADSDHALLLIKSYVTGNPTADRAILNGWLSGCLSGSAHVRVMHGILPKQEMVGLVRLATVFATASRGEGYCLPAVEAMSCGKPVIAAAWSAFRDFVSMPVEYRIENVPREVILPGYSSNHRWAVLDEDHLATQMAWVHAHRAQVSALGRTARAWVLKHAAPGVVGRILRRRLEGLIDRPAPVAGGDAS